jgi:hypothetical protein
MELSEEQLEEITELGSCFFSALEVCEIMELDALGPSGKKALRKGQLISEASIRKSIIDIAGAGSSPAQTLAMKLLDSLKRNE